MKPWQMKRDDAPQSETKALQQVADDNDVVTGELERIVNDPSIKNVREGEYHLERLATNLEQGGPRVDMRSDYQRADFFREAARELATLYQYAPGVPS